METTFTSFQQGVMDGLQKAYKITANSIYGQMGAKTSPVKMIPIAACTTATGRNLLMTAKNFISDNYQDKTVALKDKSIYVKKSKTVYGDSVLPDTPLLIRRNGRISTIRIDELAGLFDTERRWGTWHESKEHIEQKESEQIYIWTETGFTRIKRVIRHCSPVPRKIIRVLTHTGIVDVTEDHSLLCSEGNKIKPCDVAVGDELLHASMDAIVDTTESDSIITEEEAWLMGYNYENIVPTSILNSSLCIVESYFRGFIEKYGFRNDGEDKLFDCKGKQGTMGLYTIATRLGYCVSINTRMDKPDIYRCTCTRNTQRKKSNAIKKKYVLYDNYDGYVYDISTENHHFHVGPGRLVVSNTDSVFLVFNAYDKKGGKPLKGTDLLKASIDLGVIAGEQITKTLKAPHDLEYEKTFFPFILLSKKRYVGMKYEFDVNKCKQTSMGIVLKRRDNAKIVKYVYGGAIDIIMKEQQLLKAMNFVKNSVYKLMNGKFGMDYLIITKSLRSYYKNPDQIAHKVLADRMGERDPGNKPKSNDRIPYVYIVKKCRKKEKVLQGDKIEHPDYIREHKLKIDYRHYITNQIAKPVCQVFALELEKIPKYQLTPKLKKRIREWEEVDPEDDEKKNKKYGFLRNEREKQTNELLFSDSVNRITNKMNKQTEIRNFFKPVVIPK